MLRILDRYLLRELATSFLATAAVLLIIGIGETVVQVLGRVAKGAIPAELLFSMIALQAVGSLTVILPLAVFLGVLLAYGRLYRDSEMAVLAASGLDVGGLLRPLALLALPIMIVLALVSFWLAPASVRLSQQLVADANRSLLLAGLEPGRFVTLPGRGGVIYVGEMSNDGTHFKRMFVESERVQPDGSSQIDIVTASRGELYHDADGEGRFLALQDGFRVEGRPGQDDFRLMRFARNDIRMPDNDTDDSDPDTAAKRAASNAELWRSTDPLQQAELHWRLGPPVSALLLILLALPLSRSSPRSPRYGALIIAVLGYIIYANVLAMGRVWLSQERIDMAFGLWWVYLPTLAIAWLLIWRGQTLTRRSRRAA